MIGLSLLAVSPAHALDPKWGTGLHLGTNILPAGSPIAYPPKINTFDFDEDGEADDIDGDGEPDATTLDKVRGDLIIGADLYVWPTGGLRAGLTGNVDVGDRFSSVSILGILDKTVDLDAAYLLVGGGAGFSSNVWRGDDEERLILPAYPLRAQIGALLPINDFLAVDGRIVGQMAVPVRHRYFDPTGAERDVSGVPFTYTTLGIELGFSYGLFR
ncbi:MAG: hypothetical protein ABMB14_24465 [Myxococcota bacterium]